MLGHLCQFRGRFRAVSNTKFAQISGNKKRPGQLACCQYFLFKTVFTHKYIRIYILYIYIYYSLFICCCGCFVRGQRPGTLWALADFRAIALSRTTPIAENVRSEPWRFRWSTVSLIDGQTVAADPSTGKPRKTQWCTGFCEYWLSIGLPVYIYCRTSSHFIF